MFQVSVVNYSSAISEREMHRVVRAINRQVAEDFAPYWAFGGRLRVEGPASRRSTERSLKELRGDAIIFVLDSAKDRSALGYHSRNLLGVPIGYVFLDLCKELGDDWSTTLSHETLELIADPQCNLMVRGPHPEHGDRKVYHYFEMCDAVQSQTYEIDGVMVSNFVLPHYFTEDEEDAARNDFCGTGLRSFRVNAGGYIGYFDPVTQQDSQYFANSIAMQRFDIKKSTASGRVMLRTSQWKQAFAESPGATESAAGDARASNAPVEDPIKHVVVLMLENRSFDHMLGGLTTFDPNINGVPAQPESNVDSATNVPYLQKPDARPTVGPDFKVPHEFDDVWMQMYGSNNDSPMSGFVDAYRHANPATTTPNDLQQVMSYFREDSLPVLHTLAKHFLICDNWFSSMPGPTWPNRFFVHSGTSLGDYLMPTPSLNGVGMFFGRYTQPTIFGRLSKKGIPWRIYHSGIPQSIVLNELKDDFLFSDRYQAMDRFYEDCAGNARDFPAYAFIEPRYFNGFGEVQNDQHTPAGVVAGEQLIASVFNAIRQNQALWESTLLIITYDEHGGFYDHVMPPRTVAPDSSPIKNFFMFDQLGVRVPAVLVSPWVDRAVDKTRYDHTSILRYLCEKWGLPAMSRRADPGNGELATGTFAPVIRKEMREGLLASVGAGLAQPAHRAAGMAAAPAQADFDDAQTALVLYAELARQDHALRQQAGKAPRAAMAPKPPATGQELSMQARAMRAEAWIRQRRSGRDMPSDAELIELTEPLPRHAAPATGPAAPLPAADVIQTPAPPVVPTPRRTGKTSAPKRPLPPRVATNGKKPARATRR